MEWMKQKSLWGEWKEWWIVRVKNRGISVYDLISHDLGAVQHII